MIATYARCSPKLGSDNLNQLIRRSNGTNQTRVKIKELICVLRRFKREVSKAAIFPEIKKHRHFETPIENISARKKPNTSSVKDGGKAAIEVTLLKIQFLQIEIASFFDTSGI